MPGAALFSPKLQLIETYGKTITDPTKRAKFEADTGERQAISRKYEALWKRLEPLTATLDSLGHDLHVILDRVFDLIRSTRNDAGHPSGKLIERETVHANLLLFPMYCRRVYGLIEHFAVNPIP